MNDTSIEDLTVPDPALTPNKEFKAALANSRRSAALGVWLIVVPLFFLFCVLMKYSFHVNLQLFTIVEEFFAAMDRNPALHWLSPVLFMLFPLVSAALNAMAMTNVQWNKETYQAVITVRLRLVNFFLLCASLVVVGIMGLYLITENLKG